MQLINIDPTPGNCVVQRRPAEAESPSGLVRPVTPESNRENRCIGKVLAVGIPKDADYPPTFDAGNVVVFKQHAGHVLTVKEEEYIILSFEDVLAVLELGDNPSE